MPISMRSLVYAAMLCSGFGGASFPTRSCWLGEDCGDFEVEEVAVLVCGFWFGEDIVVLEAGDSVGKRDFCFGFGLQRIL